MLYHLKREVFMFVNILRGILSVCAGAMFLFLLNSIIFFNSFELEQLSNDYLLLMIFFSFAPLFVAILFFGEEFTMFKNFMLNGAYVLSGLLIAQGFFVAYNDNFVARNTTKAYQEIQKKLNITDTGTYGSLQLDFLKDKADNNYKALSKYVDDKNNFKVADIEKTAGLILAMNANKDPVLQEQFDKILADKVVTVRELDNFNEFVIQHKMKQLK
jgi:hypothetical protein